VFVGSARDHAGEYNTAVGVRLMGFCFDGLHERRANTNTPLSGPSWR